MPHPVQSTGHGGFFIFQGPKRPELPPIFLTSSLCNVNEKKNFLPQTLAEFFYTPLEIFVIFFWRSKPVFVEFRKIRRNVIWSSLNTGSSMLRILSGVTYWLFEQSWEFFFLTFEIWKSQNLKFSKNMSFLAFFQKISFAYFFIFWVFLTKFVFIWKLMVFLSLFDVIHWMYLQGGWK